MSVLGFSTSDSQVVKLWSNRIYKDFITDSGLLAAMLEAGIVSRQDQPSRGAGDTVTVSWLKRLTNAGLVGMQSATGQETTNYYYTQQVILNQLRNPLELPNVQTISQQRVLYDLPEDAYKTSMDWLSVRGTVSILNQLAGFNPTYFTYDTVTYGQANIPKTSLQGMNPVLAPSANRVYYANGYTTDDQVQADPTATMRLSNIDQMEAMAEAFQPYIRPISERSGIKYHLYVHTYQYMQLIQDTTAPIQFRDLYGNLVMAGKTDGGIGRSFVYSQTEIFKTDKIPCGVSSSTNLVLPNVRRAVFCGRDAAAMVLGRGFEDGKEIVPGFIIREDTVDIQQIRRIAISAIWGIAKLQFNSIDHGVIVNPTYVANTTGNQ